MTAMNNVNYHQPLVDLKEKLAIKNVQLELVPKGRYNRLKSWDECYLFCQKHYSQLSEEHIDSDALDLATTQLAFYLASFGMYRGTDLLQCSRYVLEPVIKDVFGKVREHQLRPWQTEFDPKVVKELRDTVNETLSETLRNKAGREDANVTQTLSSKILLGMLACTPAYDELYKAGIKHFKKIVKNWTDGEQVSPEYRKLVSKLSSGFSERSMKALNDFLKEPQTRKFFNDLPYFFEDLSVNPDGTDCPRLKVEGKDEDIPYPLMRKVDLFFWKIGEKLNPPKKWRPSGKASAGVQQ